MQPGLATWTVYLLFFVRGSIQTTVEPLTVDSTCTWSYCSTIACKPLELFPEFLDAS